MTPDPPVLTSAVGFDKRRAHPKWFRQFGRVEQLWSLRHIEGRRRCLSEVAAASIQALFRVDVR